MPAAPADKDILADLGKLTPELRARGLQAQVVTPSDGLTFLDVRQPALLALSEKIFLSGGWFYWPYAERIAARDDLAGAADLIARVLRVGDGAPGQ